MMWLLIESEMVQFVWFFIADHANEERLFRDTRQVLVAPSFGA